MELQSMTTKENQVAFTLRGQDGRAASYTVDRLPGETLADAAVRIEEWMRQLRQGLRKPLDPF